jgi:hypothetical protein
MLGKGVRVGVKVAHYSASPGVSDPYSGLTSSALYPKGQGPRSAKLHEKSASFRNSARASGGPFLVFSPLPLSQPYSGTAAVLVDEHDAGRLERAPNDFKRCATWLMTLQFLLSLAAIQGGPWRAQRHAEISLWPMAQRG